MFVNAQKQTHAKQERNRRLRKKKLLVRLKSRASMKDATKSDRVAYDEALKARNSYLKRERMRKQSCRKKLKEMILIEDKRALAKVRKIKEQKRKQYKKNKTLGKCKEWEQKRRTTQFWNYIKRKITTEHKPINKHCVK